MKGAGVCSLNREVHYIVWSLNRVLGVIVLQHLYNVCSKKNDFILCNTDWAKKNYLINVMHIRIPIRISEDLLSSFSKYPAAFKNRTKIPAIMYLVPTSNGALRWVCVTKLNKFL